MNGGTCSEGTESFTCDCTDTGFTGRACNEITCKLIYRYTYTYTFHIQIHCHQMFTYAYTFSYINIA